MKAIDTIYNGYKFRSRLEAKWAKYFDELGGGWLYEHEGFNLGNGDFYLPDFYFPSHNLYAEIKPTNFTEQEHNKCVKLCVQSGCDVIQLVGLPSNRPMDVNQYHEFYQCPECFNIVSNPKRKQCKCKYDLRYMKSVNKTRAVLLLVSDKPSFIPLYYTEIPDVYTEDKRILEAMDLAKQSRFEFNDKNK